MTPSESTQETESSPTPVYLSLGSNLGDRLDNLRAAVNRLRPVVDITTISSVYETAPLGVEAQPPFLNLALVGTTALTPHQLLESIKNIEREVGRRPTYRWGPRIVDIDIILFGDRVVDDGELTIPHTEVARRAFVLVPLAEIAPDVVVPGVGRTIRQLAAQADRSGVRFFGHFA